MKKKLAFIIAISIAVTVCIGVVFAANVADNGSPKEIIQPLTEEDKAVKAEIAKHSDTKIDFRYNRQETIGDKTFDVSFSEFNSISTLQGVIYTNDQGDEFEYNVQTGKPIHIVLKSNITTKSVDSIDIETAHKLALEYFPKDKRIEEYKQTIYLQTSDGYVFWYTKHIGKYTTADEFSIQIGFDGAIIYISDLTDVFADKKINFDEKFIDSKIENFAKETGAVNIDYDNAIVRIRENKVCVSVPYEIVTDGGAKSCFVTDIPLE